MVKDYTKVESGWRCAIKHAISASVLSSVLAAGATQADSGVIYFTDPISPKPLYDRLEIESDGTNYMGTADGVGRIDTDLFIHLNAGDIGAIKNWRAWIQVATALDVTKGWINLPENLQETYPIGSRPDDVWGTFGLPVSFSSHGANFCNLMASNLRRQGLSDAEIFAVDRQVLLELRPAVSYEMSGPSNINDMPVEVPAPGSESYGDLKLICQAYVPPVSDEGPTRDPVASIAYANLALAFDEQPTECPTEVIAQALFTSPTKGKFTVRLRDAFGHASKLVELQMREADKIGSHYVKNWNQGFLVGAPEKGGDVHPPLPAGDNELVAGQNGEPPIVPDSRPGAGAPDQLSDHEGHPNEHVNSVWVEIVSAGLGSETETDHEEYRILCPVVLNPDIPVHGDELTGAKPPIRANGIKAAQSWSN